MSRLISLLDRWRLGVLRWRYPLGCTLQQWAWFLNDPYERWIIEYRAAEGMTWVEHVGSYSGARVRARELHGRVASISRPELPGESAHDRGSGPFPCWRGGRGGGEERLIE